MFVRLFYLVYYRTFASKDNKKDDHPEFNHSDISEFSVHEIQEGVHQTEVMEQYEEDDESYHEEEEY